jgi:hypothetical protein
MASLVVVPSGQVGCANGAGLKAEGEPCPGPANLRPIGYRKCAALCHLTGATTPVFRGPADRRWWHVVLGDDAASWMMDVRVDEISGSGSSASPARSRRSPGRSR